MNQGTGIGAVAGRPSYLYQKNITGGRPQMIQLAVSSVNQEDIRLIFSNNVSQQVRNSINDIINEHELDSEKTLSLNF
ncbi:hypothetical protein LEAN103870_17730 [Legionella anisa]|nr:hypothetical protein [Legionella anisa]KTC70520.1 hypothetical protein Lani_2067 [Legionella anisa]MBN5936973.1 hypothetical protein [Legionella anisa]